MNTLLLLASLAHADDLLLTHARLWDGTGAPVVEDTSLLVRAGRIAAIGAPPADLTGLRVVDLEGGTVIPGLIDSHVHLVSNPGSHWRQDSEDDRRAQLRQAMRAYLACGVTTLYDPGSLPAYWREVQAWVEAGEPAPELRTSGIALSPVGGYLNGAFPGYPHVSDAAELTRVLDENDALGSYGYKVAIEAGFVGGGWPVFDATMRRTIVDEAARRGKPLFIHAIGPDELDMALAMRPYTLVHTPSKISSEQIDRIRELGSYVTSTFAYDDMTRYGRDPERLGDPLLRLVVPAAQLATATDPTMFRRYRQAVADVILKPRLLRPIAVKVMGGRRFAERRLSDVGAVMARLRAASIPVIMGSDAGNWPVFPYLFHGVSSLRELELLVEQKVPAADALIAATATPARMLGLADRTGTLTVGKEADLVVLGGDPLKDIHALWSVRYTMSDGELRSPEGWMKD